MATPSAVGSSKTQGSHRLPRSQSAGTGVKRPVARLLGFLKPRSVRSGGGGGSV
jgi:hypothetical protein